MSQDPTGPTSGQVPAAINTNDISELLRVTKMNLATLTRLKEALECVAWRSEMMEERLATIENKSPPDEEEEEECDPTEPATFKEYVMGGSTSSIAVRSDGKILLESGLDIPYEVLTKRKTSVYVELREDEASDLLERLDNAVADVASRAAWDIIRKTRIQKEKEAKGSGESS